MIEHKVLEKLKILRVSIIQEHGLVIALTHESLANFVGLILIELLNELVKEREDTTAKQVIFVLVGQVHLRHDVEVVSADQKVHRIPVLDLLLDLNVSFEVLDNLDVQMNKVVLLQCANLLVNLVLNEERPQGHCVGGLRNQLVQELQNKALAVLKLLLDYRVV